MRILLDTTALSNFARVKLDYVLKQIWGNEVCIALEVAEEYQAGVKTGSMPSLALIELITITPTPEEVSLSPTMPQRLGRGERASIAFNRGTPIATGNFVSYRPKVRV